MEKIPLREKLKSPVPISEIFEGVISSLRRADIFDLQTISRTWKDSVGDIIAKEAKPYAINEKLLVVNVSSPPWMQQLLFLKQEIIDKLNSKLNRSCINDIKFQIGPVG